MTEILRLPQYMKLVLYLELRMTPAYESLWDDIIKQILSQSSLPLLTNALTAVSHLLTITATPLSTTNGTKILELEEELADALRTVVAGKEELDTATFDEEEGEVKAVEACLARVRMLFERRDLSAWMEEDDDGKRASAWSIVGSLMERGRLGRKEEEKVGCCLILPSLQGGILTDMIAFSSSLTMQLLY